MDPRKRNRLVTIKSPPTGQDSAGQPSGSWSTLRSTWANVRFMSGSESLKAGAPVATAQASIRLGYCTDVTNAMRVELGSTVFQILSVLPDLAGKQHTDLVCEVVA